MSRDWSLWVLLSYDWLLWVLLWRDCSVLNLWDYWLVVTYPARGATSRTYSTPIICLVMEGGSNTIRSVLDCLTDQPPVPVVVCDGSGRAADLLAFTNKYTQDDGWVTLTALPLCQQLQLVLSVTLPCLSISIAVLHTWRFSSHPSRWTGLASFYLGSWSLHASSLTPSQQEKKEKGRQCRKRSGGKVHSTRGNWCRDFDARCPS